ncbi:MAG: hypothetical protein JWL76_2116 [Thermoleophilia bacterium]|nr:hypothetical protein [Thermoleophilia bacterium]
MIDRADRIRAAARAAEPFPIDELDPHEIYCECRWPSRWHRWCDHCLGVLPTLTAREWIRRRLFGRPPR